MITCEKCGSDKFHYNNELGIICDACIKRRIPTYQDWLDQGCSKYDEVNSNEIFV